MAVRGDRLALVASVLSSDDGSTEQRLGIHQVDAGGRLVALTLFDPTDVMDAVAELDRIWLDEVGREANAAYAQVSDNFQRAISGGWTWESFFSKDLAFTSIGSFSLSKYARCRFTIPSWKLILPVGFRSRFPI